MNLRKMIANVASRSLTQHLVAPVAQKYDFRVYQVGDEVLRFVRPAKDGGTWNLEIGYFLSYSLLELGEQEEEDTPRSLPSSRITQGSSQTCSASKQGCRCFTRFLDTMAGRSPAVTS